MTFEELGLAAPILQAVKDCGYESPTPIQERAIPCVLAKKDVIGASQTGTGKSAAFALPLLSMIEPLGRPQVLVLEPTRELADQLAEAFRTALLQADTPTANYLKRSPHLADHLESGLEALGIDRYSVVGH